MKTKTLRLPVLFASAGALICTVSVARAADAALEVRQDQSTTQKEVINEPSGAERTYSTRIESAPSYDSSYSSRTYESGAALDPDAEGDRIMHMYQRGRHAAESLDRQIKPNPIVVLPGATTFESSQSVQYPPTHLGELHQRSYSSTSSFNEPAAAERETTTSSSTTRRYTTSENIHDTTSSTAMLSSGTTMKASDLMGMNIKNEQGDRIGEVKDVVIDMKSGRVAYAVVSAGGIAGIGDKWLAVPPSVLMRTGTEKTLTWNIEKEKLSSAPTIDKGNWNAAFQQDYIANVYNFYGVEGYHAEAEVTEPAGSQKDKDQQHNQDQQYKHDSQQQDHQNDQSRNDSSSSDLKGQAAAASVSTESTQQSDLQKSEPEKSAAVSSSADVSKEAAGAQPSSSSSVSTDVSAPAAQSSSSSSQELKSEPQSGVSSSQDTSSSTLNESAGAATPSSTSTSGGAVTEKVQMALKNDASLSGAAEDVHFSMDNDKLVVKGTVKSEDEKNRILEKVRATAGSTQVDDQLKVSASSDDSNK